MATVPPLLRAILAEANRLAPGRSHASDGTVGDPAHQAQGARSDHNPDARNVVHAVDVTHDPAHGFDAWTWANRVRERCKAGTETRVKNMVVYDPGRNHDVWTSPNNQWGWSLNGSVADHKSHLHVSIRTGVAVEQSTAPFFPVAGTPAPPSGGKVVPQFSPPAPVVSIVHFHHATLGECAAALTADGGVLCDPDNAYLGGVNGQPYFKGRTPARIERPTAAEAAAGKSYVIVATSGERYHF